MKHWKAHSLLLLVLALALAVRAAGLLHESLTMDEITELRLARLPVEVIIGRADGFPPLYQLVLKTWLHLWGTADAARWLSALLGMISVFAVYRFAAETSGAEAAVAAGVLMACSPLHAWFAQEARAYALVLPLAALAFWRFARACTTNSWRDWLLYAAIALAGSYTHYYFAFLIAIHAFWILPSIWRGARAPEPPLGAHALLAVLAVPLLFLVRGDLSLQSGTGLESLSIGDLLYTPYSYLLGFSTGLSIRELHNTGITQATTAFLPWVVAVGICVAVLLEPLVHGVSYERATYRYLLTMIGCPILLCALLATILHVKYKVSYVVWASIPLILLLARGVALGWHRRLTRFALAGYVALALVSLANRHLVDRYRNEDLRSLAAYLTQHSTPDTPVLVVAGYMAEPVRFYLGSGWSVRSLPAASVATASLPAVGGDLAGPFWLVYTRPFHGDPDGRLRRYLATSDRIRLDAHFAGTELYRADAAQLDAHSPS